MAYQLLQLFTLTTFLISSFNPLPAKSDNPPLPAFSFGWLNDADTFVAGETAKIKVRVLGSYESGKYKFPFNPNITVNDKMGNSSFITGLSLHFNGGTENWSISFLPIMVGVFHVLITDEHFRVLDSSLEFHVNPGPMYPAAGILSWRDGVNEFIAGTKAEIFILHKDAFGNNVSSLSEKQNLYNYSLSASTSEGIQANVLDINNKGWNKDGFLNIEFVVATAGSFLLHVETENQTLHGSPLPFMVHPGNMDVHSCVPKWNVETNYFQLFSMMEGFIHQHDRYGNIVSGSYEFEIEVIEKGTNLSMPLADLIFTEIGASIQSFSFSLYEPGDFMLMISDKDKNAFISNMPYNFTVYIGYCDGVKSIVNGSGLNTSAAGDIVEFSVFLKDAYLYPSPVELESIKVQIRHESDTSVVHPSIQIREAPNGSFSSGRLNYGAIDPMRIASPPVFEMRNSVQFSGNRNNKASNFDVTYKPEKSGVYEIRVFCGNIPLNDGHSFRKEVKPGVVNVTISGIVRYTKQVPKMIKNEIVVRLMDSYYNPVLLQQSKLKLEMASINRSAFTMWNFADNNDGTYSVSYMAKDVGTFEICASFDGKRFVPCPFGVEVHDNKYFPEAYNDTVLVWEDESIAFNVLENDYFASGNASILEFSKPGYGSLLQHGNLLRYTPYKRYYGNDSFSYTISDINGNIATGAVELLILCRPPQLVSIPSDLQATEDTVSPTFSGFLGIEIIYSDSAENITVTLSSQSGTLLLSPRPMQFWHPRWDELSVFKEVGEVNRITFVGCLDAINFALEFIKYFGNENFYGSDTIRISATNKNGKNNMDVPIYVQPVNDPPIINVPSFVVFDDMSDGVLIFDDLRNNSGFIQDPDVSNFPGDRSRFLIMFSIEVSAGLLSTSLPSELIGSTELKVKRSYQWQPIQTFVTISKHFLVKAKGIRFRGSIDDCNTIMEQLSYHDGEHGAVLTVTVNDLGNHGCYPNCGEMMSMSLFAESTVNLLNEKPMSSLAAHTLGSAIIIESIAVLSLGLLLLFFICKCALDLVHEKKQQKAEDNELSKLPASSGSPGNKNLSTGFCLLPFLLRGSHANNQRSPNISGTEEADHIIKSSPASFGDRPMEDPDPTSGIVPSVPAEG